MAWRLAKSLVRLREQINAAYPDRDKESDGTVGDLSHRQRVSDHNPNAAGVVTAIDIDENLTGPTGEASGTVRALQASRDPRIKYIIYEGRITVKGDITRWKPYSGVNPHRHHFHLSVASSPSLYDDGRDWQISAAAPAGSPVSNPVASTQKSTQTGRNAAGVNPPSPSPMPLLKRGSKGKFVVLLQQKLGMTNADGDFGPKTEAAVKNFQVANGLTVDGKVGPATRKALGL